MLEVTNPDSSWPIRLNQSYIYISPHINDIYQCLVDILDNFL